MSWKDKSYIALGLVLIQVFLLWLGYYMSSQIAWTAVILLIPFVLWYIYTVYMRRIKRLS
jgi:tryptophan-rich sensory protein